MKTFRMTLEAMDAGDNILIFPENTDKKYPREGIGDLSPGFLILADLYWKRRNKRLRMLPMYADKKHRTITFGEIIEYNPDNDAKEEQDRIINETQYQIWEIAKAAEEEKRK